MTDTALLERVVTSTVHTLPAGVTAVRSNPAEYSRGDSYALYVTAAEMGNNERRIGTVVSVVPAPSGNGWLLPGGDGRLYGSVVNPPRVDGRHYYIKDVCTARYNDDMHIPARNRASDPWSLVLTASGAAWPVANDSMQNLSADLMFIEVNIEVSDVGQGEPVVAVIDNAASITGPVRGMGHVEEDGTVLLNPERVFGQRYVVFDTSNHPRSATWWDNGEGGKWLYHGYFTTYGSTVEHEHFTRITEMVDPSWAKIRMRRRSVQVPTNEILLESQRQQLRDEVTKWQEMNEALNEMATDKGHCSDYDAIVTAVGMEPRNRKYDIEVTATVEWTDESPSSRLDTALTNEYDGLNIEATSITVTAKVIVTIYEQEGSDGDAAGANIASSDVEDKLDGELPSGYSLIDWEVSDSNVSS